jgi:hypothetical protein
LNTSRCGTVLFLGPVLSQASLALSLLARPRCCLLEPPPQVNTKISRVRQRRLRPNEVSPCGYHLSNSSESLSQLSCWSPLQVIGGMFSPSRQETANGSDEDLDCNVSVRTRLYRTLESLFSFDLPPFVPGPQMAAALEDAAEKHGGWLTNPHDCLNRCAARTFSLTTYRPPPARPPRYREHAHQPLAGSSTQVVASRCFGGASHSQ